MREVHLRGADSEAEEAREYHRAAAEEDAARMAEITRRYEAFQSDLRRALRLARTPARRAEVRAIMREHEAGFRRVMARLEESRQRLAAVAERGTLPAVADEAADLIAQALQAEDGHDDDR